MDSLWGEEFKVEEKVKTKKIISKLKEKKEPTELSTEKLVKSKKISDEEKLTLVEDEVNRVLCKQKENVLTIFSRVELETR
jgi:predicted ribosome-associated RNA-binding protein Tma20